MLTASITLPTLILCVCVCVCVCIFVCVCKYVQVCVCVCMQVCAWLWGPAPFCVDNHLIQTVCRVCLVMRFHLQYVYNLPIHSCTPAHIKLYFQTNMCLSYEWMIYLLCVHMHTYRGNMIITCPSISLPASVRLLAVLCQLQTYLSVLQFPNHSCILHHCQLK